MRAATVLAIIALVFAASAGASGCNCGNALTADYGNTLVPDACQSATTSIHLDTDAWKVVFVVDNVLSVTNGHVIAANVNSRQTVATALTNLTQAYTTADVWNPPACGLGPLDLPADWLGITTAYNNNTCTRSYTIEYSLVSPLDQNHHHCQLSQAGENILVECELQVNTIRAYDATEPTAFLNKETVFRTNITMPRNLPNEVSTLLSATLAKCSVYAAPDFFIDCRIPGTQWNFEPTFAIAQSPEWINASTCQQSHSATGTHIKCDLVAIVETYVEVNAVIEATPLNAGTDKLHFAVNYSLPREETASATGALTTFIKNIGTKDAKFFYGNDDLLTLEIEVVDTTRLEITHIGLFNSDVPVQEYDLRTTPEFETVETKNATHFVITFYPARKIDDSNFYRHGPHGVNVSFLFTAARRQQSGDAGVVTYRGFALKAPHQPAAEQKKSNGSTAIVGITAGVCLCAIVVVALVAGVATRRSKAAVAAKTVAPVDPESNPAPSKADNAEVDHATVEIKDAI